MAMGTLMNFFSQIDTVGVSIIEKRGSSTTTGFYQGRSSRRREVEGTGGLRPRSELRSGLWRISSRSQRWRYHEKFVFNFKSFPLFDWIILSMI